MSNVNCQSQMSNGTCKMAHVKWHMSNVKFQGFGDEDFDTLRLELKSHFVEACTHRHMHTGSGILGDPDKSL